MIETLFSDPREFVAILVALVVAITVHEFSHALAATLLGDTLPEKQGRLTLSPLAHLDPVGSLLMLIGGFGWGRPVQYNPYALRAGPRSGPAMVALAGPASNILLAALLGLIVRALRWSTGGAFAASDLGFVSGILLLLTTIIRYNLFLAFFNLIPIFPLDGFSVLLGLLPPSLAVRFEQTRAWGIFALLALVLLGGTVLSFILVPPVALLYRLLVGT